MKPSPKASASASFLLGRSDWLDRLPLAALLIDAELRILSTNSAAESLAANLSLESTNPLTIAIQRAFKEDRTTHLRDVALGPLGVIHAWVSPYNADAALLLADLAAPKETANYTQLSATMAAMLAHEIRNPLLSIKGAAQLLKESVAVEDAPLCDLIGKEVDRLEQLIATLDPLSVTPQKHMSVLNVHEVLEHARLAIAAAFPAITFILDYDPSLPEIPGHHDALVQALLNVMKNAAEAASGKEQPTITLTSRYVVGETPRNAEGKPLPIAISMTDNGPGIAAEFAGRLFAPFSSQKPGGKGLGLAVVAKIIEEHKGLILYEPAPSCGARFTLYLPVAGR